MATPGLLFYPPFPHATVAIAPSELRRLGLYVTLLDFEARFATIVGPFAYMNGSIAFGDRVDTTWSAAWKQ